MLVAKPTFRPRFAVAVVAALGFALISGFAVLPSAAVSSPETQADSAPAPRVRLAAIGVVAERFDEMVAFYRDVLGFEVALESEGPFVELRSEGVRFQILAQSTMADASGYRGFAAARSGHSFELAFEVGDPAEVDEMFARIVAAGAEPIAPPADKPWGQRMAFFADPDGNIHDVYAEL